jgi:phage shock protein A
MAIERAEDKTAQLQARSGAIDELLASGALDSPVNAGQDDIALELDRMASGSEVETELASMKAALGSGSETKAIEADTPPGAAETVTEQAKQEEGA